MNFCVDCGKKNDRHPQALRCPSCMYKPSESRRGPSTAFSAPAQQMVKQAIQMGYLPKLDGSIRCSDCTGSADRYDHRDYWKPLEVDPVCRMCNMRRGPALKRPIAPIIKTKSFKPRKRA